MTEAEPGGAPGLREILGRPRVRSIALCVLGLAAAAGFAHFLDGVYPLRRWLLADLIVIAGWLGLLAAACVSFGHFLIVRVLGLRDLLGLELLCTSAAAGVVVFVTGMYLFGFAGLYGRVLAVAWPSVLLLGGVPAARPLLRAMLDARGRAGLAGLPLAATIFGSLCLGVVYLGLLSPDALNYDAAWMHVVIGQDYAREGRIVPYTANWVMNVPHLASMVYAWGFMVPGLDEPALRWMMALHTEFAFLLGTLVGIAAAVRWLANEPRVRGTWAALFLFPGIFVYDGNLGGSADHVLAYFAPPLLLSAVRAARDLDPRACALFGVVTAGAALTKLQAAYLVVPLGLLLVASGARLAAAARRAGSPPRWRALLLGPACAAACAAVLASPHFLQNLAQHGNPLYPFAQGLFTGSVPTVPGAAEMVDTLLADWRWRPPKDILPRIWKALELAFTFSFRPHYSFAGDLPTFGSLFSLSLVFLPFLPGARRLWLGAAVGLAALFGWATTYWVDRNLHSFAPVLAAATGAILFAAWRVGGAVRAGVAVLVLLQIAWAGALAFSGADRLASGIALVRSGAQGRAQERYDGYRRSYVVLGRALPRDAVVVLHNAHLSLGIDRRILLDWVGFQGLIDYRTFRTPRELHDRFAALGVTHIVTVPGSRAAASKQEEVVFAAFVAGHARPAGRFGELALYQMPAAPPPVEPPMQVLALAIPGYADGLYAISQLSTCEESPPERQRFAAPRAPVPDPSAVAGMLGGASAALVGAGARLDAEATAALARDYRVLVSYPSFTVYGSAR